MNSSIIKLGGKDKTIYHNMTDEQFQLQYKEVFKEQHYKLGKRKRDMVILDVGANIGLTCLYFKDWAKVIYALEPSMQHYDALVKNVKDYSHIKPFKLALASANGIDKMYSNDDGTIPESFFGNGNSEEIVNIVTLKKFITDHKIKHIDLMKVDTEGGEYYIFPSDGFRDVADKIDCIIGESHPNVHRHEMVKAMLEDVGFKFKFLPTANLFIYLDYTETSTKKTRRFKLFLNTLFVAERKHAKTN